MQIKKQEYGENRLERLKAENRSIKEKLASKKRENNDLKKLLKNKNGLFNSIPAGIVLVQEGKILDIIPLIQHFGCGTVTFQVPLSQEQKKH